MKKIKTFLLTSILILNFQSISFSKDYPGSFADLAEKLMPSVVNISTTTIVKTQSNHFLFNFHQDHHLRTCSKNLEHLKKDNQQP